MTRTIAATISDDAFRIYSQIPHGKKSALIENLLTKWASQYDRDRHTGELIQPKPKDSLDELEEKVDAYVVRHTTK